MSVVTVGRWIDLPTSVNTPLATDEPLGAGTLQVAASTANFGCRVNNLRVLWEHPGPGSDEILGNVGYDSNPESLNWDTAPTDASRVFVAFAGVFRIRSYGGTGVYPKLVLKALASNSAATVGIILVARSSMGKPSPGDLYGSVTHTGTTPTLVTITLPLTPGSVGSRSIAPVLGTTYPIPEPVESGSDNCTYVYVGAWGNSGKGTVSGITLYLEDPT